MKYTSGYKYQLYADEWMHTNIKPSNKIVTEYIELWLDGWMLVKRGYAWDGPSGPTWDTDDTMTASLFHDAAYQLMRMKLLKPAWREWADIWLGKMMFDRASKWQPLRGIQYARAKLWTRETIKFAAGAANPKNRKKVLEVP